MGSTSKPSPPPLLPSNTSNISVAMTTTSQITQPTAESHALAYVLVPLGVLGIVAILAFIVSNIKIAIPGLATRYKYNFHKR